MSGSMCCEHCGAIIIPGLALYTEQGVFCDKTCFDGETLPVVLEVTEEDEDFFGTVNLN